MGEPPLVLSMEGAGESVTELVWEIRCDRLGKVSEAELFSSGQWLPKGEGGEDEVSEPGPGLHQEVGHQTGRQWEIRRDRSEFL